MNERETSLIFLSIGAFVTLLNNGFFPQPHRPDISYCVPCRFGDLDEKRFQSEN